MSPSSTARPELLPIQDSPTLSWNSKAAQQVFLGCTNWCDQGAAVLPTSGAKASSLPHNFAAGKQPWYSRNAKRSWAVVKARPQCRCSVFFQLLRACSVSLMHSSETTQTQTSMPFLGVWKTWKEEGLLVTVCACSTKQQEKRFKESRALKKALKQCSTGVWCKDMGHFGGQQWD